MSNTILVTGATGKTGSRVISRLDRINIPERIGNAYIQKTINTDAWNQKN